MAITQKEISNLIVSMFDAAGGAANLTSLEANVALQDDSYTLENGLMVKKAYIKYFRTILFKCAISIRNELQEDI